MCPREVLSGDEGADGVTHRLWQPFNSGVIPFVPAPPNANRNVEVRQLQAFRVRLRLSEQGSRDGSAFLGPLDGTEPENQSSRADDEDTIRGEPTRAAAGLETGIVEPGLAVLKPGLQRTTVPATCESRSSEVVHYLDDGARRKVPCRLGGSDVITAVSAVRGCSAWSGKGLSRKRPESPNSNRALNFVIVG